MLLKNIFIFFIFSFGGGVEYAKQQRDRLREKIFKKEQKMLDREKRKEQK